MGGEIGRVATVLGDKKPREWCSVLNAAVVYVEGMRIDHFCLFVSVCFAQVVLCP
jgi:hypothetical protein